MNLVSEQERDQEDGEQDQYHLPKKPHLPLGNKVSFSQSQFQPARRSGAARSYQIHETTLFASFNSTTPPKMSAVTLTLEGGEPVPQAVTSSRDETQISPTPILSMT